ncbi:MAG: fimbrillin family protein [Coprobacter sp.]|nr:fimbrillin family protein [Coprobacter sp.]
MRRRSIFTYKSGNVVFAILLALLYSSCGEEMGHLITQSPSTIGTAEADYIRWNVRSVGMYDTRALIENNSDLQTACSVTGGRAIGIWSAYELDGVETRHVLGNDNGDVTLVYREGTAWDNYKSWTYSEEAAKWVIGAKYVFNAYYPKSAVDEISSSNISTFVVDYNTEHFQEDLMMAYAYVDTNSPTFRMWEPVPLNMLHTLSALMFRFSFINSDGSTYDDSDALTAFWLENTRIDCGIATTGMLAFGTIDDDGTMNGENILWYPEDYPDPSTQETPRKIYEWEDVAGVPFASTSSERTIAVAYSTDYDSRQKYSDNDGWLLTIPQVTDGTSQICFCLKSTGDFVHRIALPATTYEAGKRYTYDIRFGQTSVTLTLKIKAWNELQSSFDIPL